MVTKRKAFNAVFLSPYMYKAYAAQFEDTRLEALLLREQNIPIIEELLNLEFQRLKMLRELKREGKIFLGKTVQEKDLDSLVFPVYAKVDEFLDVNCAPPQVQYSTVPDYSAEDKVIYLNKWRMKKLIPVIAHEYTHHIQGITENSWIQLRDQDIFMDGHARGVERYITQRYALENDDLGFLDFYTNLHVQELRTAYKWITETCRQTPNPFFLNMKTPEADALLRCFGGDSEGISIHAKGTALFSVYESQQGSKIYKNVIHGSFNLT